MLHVLSVLFPGYNKKIRITFSDGMVIKTVIRKCTIYANGNINISTWAIHLGRYNDILSFRNGVWYATCGSTSEVISLEFVE